MERNLSICFQYDDNEEFDQDDNSCPKAVHITPDPITMSDVELVLVALSCIQTLGARNGLEQALTMVNDAAYGKLCNGTRFDTYWRTDEEKQ